MASTDMHHPPQDFLVTLGFILSARAVIIPNPVFFLLTRLPSMTRDGVYVCNQIPIILATDRRVSLRVPGSLSRRRGREDSEGGRRCVTVGRRLPGADEELSPELMSVLNISSLERHPPRLLSLLLLGVAAANIYDGHEVWRLNDLNTDQAQAIHTLLTGLDFDVWSHGRDWLDVRVPPHLARPLQRRLQELSVPHSVLIDDVQKKIDEERRVLEKSQGKTGIHLNEYNELEVIEGYMSELALEYEWVSIKSIGKTYEGRDLWVNILAVPGEAPKPAVWIDCGIHAREWITQATCVFGLQFLTPVRGGRSGHEAARCLRCLHHADAQPGWILLHLAQFSLDVRLRWTGDATPDDEALYRISEIGVVALRSVHDTRYQFGSIYNAIYPASGTSIDWSYTAGVVHTYTLELRDTGLNGFLLPPTEILPTGQETWAGLVAAIMAI
ncbi:putative carboxypeptidase A1-like [Penaeus vannamei]|uniref:Putative carboxypeptidase A1-like n=1 Tax=Penaeus vannamei TaxID=6689 RepID=A0A3R7QEK8_PENVA|nr:putative carboxypeptidase A1-like [Penaeus vannamei]